MSQWSREKVDASQLNGGREYEKEKDDLSVEQFNAIINNSLYASDTVDAMGSMGEFSETLVYKYPNIITYNGSSYMAIYSQNGQYAAFAGIVPPNSTYWKLVASKGEQGVQGERGVGVPDGGTAGQVLTKTADGTEWSSNLNIAVSQISNDLASVSNSLNTKAEKDASNLTTGNAGAWKKKLSDTYTPIFERWYLTNSWTFSGANWRTVSETIKQYTTVTGKFVINFTVPIYTSAYMWGIGLFVDDVYINDMCGDNTSKQHVSGSFVFQTTAGTHKVELRYRNSEASGGSVTIPAWNAHFYSIYDI